MNEPDPRQLSRESFLVLANLRVDGKETPHRVSVRNLSAGGMMAECDAGVARGTRVSVELRNIGWVEGTVAWKQDNRFGIAFVDAIDPTKVRDAVAGTGERSGDTRPFSSILPAGPDPEKLRKI